MKEKIIKISMVVIIILLIFSFTFSLIYNYKQKKLIKDNEQIKKETDLYIIDLEEQIEDFKNKPPVKIKEFIKLTDQEKEKAYQELSDNYNKAIKTIEYNKQVIENLNQQLDKTTKALKKSNKRIMFMPIVSIGMDSEYNFNSRIGGVIDGIIFNSSIISFGLGGGGYYSNRYDFMKEKNIPGGDIIFNIAIFF